MDITKTTIVAAINETIYSSQAIVTTTSGIRAIRAGLKWLSKQAKWKCLYVKDLAASAIASGTKTIAHPANFRILDKIILNDGTYDGEPLVLTTYQDILECREDETTSDYDEPTEYADKGANFHLKPTSDTAYTPKISYWRYHPDVTGSDPYADDTALLFGEDFEEAVNNACIAYHLIQKGRKAEGTYYLALAKSEVDDLKEAEEDFEPRFTRTREI